MPLPATVPLPDEERFWALLVHLFRILQWVRNVEEMSSEQEAQAASVALNGKQVDGRSRSGGSNRS